MTFTSKNNNKIVKQNAKIPLGRANKTVCLWWPYEFESACLLGIMFCHSSNPYLHLKQISHKMTFQSGPAAWGLYLIRILDDDWN